jgi:hypothetical protein
MASLEWVTFCILGFPRWWRQVIALIIITYQEPIVENGRFNMINKQQYKQGASQTNNFTMFNV